MKYILLLIFMSGCGMDDAKKYYRLEGLRMIGVIADTPEINTASTVNLTPYLSYTTGGDTTLDVSWEACIDPGITFGAEIKCTTTIDTGTDTFNTSTLNSVFYTGPLNNIAVAIPASSFTYLASIDSTKQFNGIDIIVIINITDQNDNTQNLKTLKRIKITSKTSGLNVNPTISGNIQNSGTDISAFPTTKSNLSLDGLSSAESYSFQANSGLTSLNETMLITWFSDKGEFLFSRSSVGEIVEFDPKGETTGVIVGVYRDNRGGLAIKRQTY